MLILLSLAWGEDDTALGHAIRQPDPSQLDARIHYEDPEQLVDIAKLKGVRELQKSKLSLSKAALTQLADDGVVVSKREFASFGTAYEDLYHEDLRVFVSADSILHAMHRTFDDTLMAVEEQALVASLDDALSAMRGTLAKTGDADDPAVVDADLYLAVAHSLLKDEPGTGAFASEERVGSLFELAKKSDGMATIELFGKPRQIDSSQFKPRGHYRTKTLEPYFRAMMWLGRIDFRPVEIIAREPVFDRRQFNAAATFALSCDDVCHRSLDRVDTTVRAFVGPPDSVDMSLLLDILEDLAITDSASLATTPDARIQAVLQERVPPQKILSHLLSAADTGTGSERQLPVSFLPLGQRYIVDSYVLSETVYGGVTGKRMMPEPLDVAYAALGNDDALRLIEDTSVHGPALLRTRAFVDAHDPESWESNLYTRWLGALRTLSPSSDGFGPAAPQSELWGRRVLNTQLASWAELRHDTLLYAKQSYTSMALCAFPDAWVEPEPRFWTAVGGYGEHAIATIEALPLPEPERKRLIAPQRQLVDAARTLGAMAVNQEQGQPHTAQQMRFLNSAVVRKYEMEGCAANLKDVRGWYPRLFLDRKRSVEFDPTIADVHTQPTDAAGNMVGHVLHVATGKPRLMTFTVETCAGPTAFAGPVSTFYTVQTSDFERLDDSAWMQRLSKSPDLEPWMATIAE